MEIREPTGILYLPTKCSYTPVPAQGYEARPYKKSIFILHSPPAEAQEEELKAAEESPEPEEKAVVGMYCFVPPVSMKGLLAHNATMRKFQDATRELLNLIAFLVFLLPRRQTKSCLKLQKKLQRLRSKAQRLRGFGLVQTDLQHSFSGSWPVRA